MPRLLVPSLSDCLFLAILLWSFGPESGWSVLLADGDTGWHIRTGEYILSSHSVPTQDLFSFSKAGEPWFAWEWLSDVALRPPPFLGPQRAWWLYRAGACPGRDLAFRYAVWRGANVIAALVATLLATGASTVHYLARPHIFTISGLTVTLWMLERDRRNPTLAVWWLVPLMALWTNLHGGFVAGIICLVLATAGAAFQAALNPPVGRRLTPSSLCLLTAACSLATLVNPYGWRLHQHMANYLTSDWIRQVVEEFQSPRFRSESMLQFEILLFGGVVLVPILFRRRQIADLLMIVFWAHAALVSARHVPSVRDRGRAGGAEEASRWWSRWSARFSRRSLGGTLRDCLSDFSAGPAAIQHLGAGFALLPSGAPLVGMAAGFPIQQVPGRRSR